MEARHCSTAPAGSAAWPQFLQTTFGFIERLGFLAKGEAHLPRSMLGILVEAGAVGHDVIRPGGTKTVKTAGTEDSQQPVAPLGVVGGELLVVLRTKGDRRGGGLLQGRRRIDCQEVMHLAD